MHLTNFIRFSYWLSFFTPKFSTTALVVAVIVLGLFFIGATVLRIVAGRKKTNPPLAKGLRRLSRPLFFFSLFELGLVGCRQLGAAVLSSRLIMFAIFVISVVWLVFSVRALLRSYTREYQKLLETRKYQAYLPKKK